MTNRIRRSRTGCQNCKGRRRKCTEEQPVCYPCFRRGLTCTYGISLTWEDETRSAGIAFGRAGLKYRYAESSKSARAPSHHYLLPVTQGNLPWINTTTRDVARHYPLYNKTDRTSSVASGLPKQIEPSPQPSLDILSANLRDGLYSGQGGGFLLQYYTCVWSPRRSLTSSSRNPYQDVIIPLSYQSQGILNIALAFAAHDLLNHAEDADKRQQYYVMMLNYKLHSLRHLQNLLSRFRPNEPGGAYGATDRTERDSLLLSIMLHTFLETSNDSTTEWVSHLSGALSMIRQDFSAYRASSPKTLFSPEVFGFVLSILSIHHIFLASTGVQVQESDDKLIHSTLLSWNKCHTIRDRFEIDCHIGLSPELLDIISCITSLARNNQHGSTSPDKAQRSMDDDLRKAWNIETRLRQLEQWSQDPDPDSLIYLNAATFHTAAWIYLRQIIPNASADEQTSIDVLHRKLMNTIRGLHEKEGALVGSLPYPMWALFVAACTVLEDNRAQILGWFTALKKHRPLSNVPSTMNAVIAIWKQFDLGHAAQRRPSYQRKLMSMVPWMETVQQLGWMMPLT